MKKIKVGFIDGADLDEGKEVILYETVDEAVNAGIGERGDLCFAFDVDTVGFVECDTNKHGWIQVYDALCGDRFDIIEDLNVSTIQTLSDLTEEFTSAYTKLKQHIKSIKDSDITKENHELFGACLDDIEKVRKSISENFMGCD